MPPGLTEANPELRDKAIKVNASLHGDQRAAALCHQQIAGMLTSAKLDFATSEIDPCPFIRQDCVSVLCVDDAILMACDEDALLKVLQEL